MNRREVKRAPVLRFKGFTNDWEQRKLGDISEIIRGASPRPISDPKWFNSNSNIGWLRISDVTAQHGRIQHLSQHISILGQAKTRVISTPHLLLSIAASVGYPVINYVKTGVHDGFLIFENPKFNIDFGFYWLAFYKHEWQKFGQPGSQVNLNSSIVKKTNIGLPDNVEQKAIVHLLKLIDNCITLQQRKLKLLRTLKSGLSFKLFNKKHLNNLSQISLDQIGQTYSGLTGKSKKDFGHGHAFYVSYLNVNQNEIGNPKQIDRIEIDKKQNLVQKNDIFFTISSETPEEVGLTSLWPVSCKNLSVYLGNEENIYLNSFCFGFRINTKMFIPLYLGYLFRSEYFREKVLPLAQGISRYNLSKNNVLKIKIGQEEIAIQEKYAKVMNDLDSDILRQKKKVKELKLCKKFLLQNMFI